MLNLKMSEESRAFLQKDFPQIFEQKTFNDAIEALDNFIIYAGLDENDERTPYGDKLERIYREIFNMNWNWEADE